MPTLEEMSAEERWMWQFPTGVPNGILTDPTLSSDAKVLFALLLWWAWPVKETDWPSGHEIDPTIDVARLATAMGSEEKVRAALAELEARDLVPAPPKMPEGMQPGEY